MTSEGVIKIYKSITFDNKVKISISDQGRGMTKEQIDQVFLPFFTTKQNGTGLGLSHAIQTVEQHGGFIEIESELNRGTTFHLYLPLSTIGNKLDNNLNDTILLNSPSGR
jgi:two-component system, sporulation sensor kinase E